MGYFNKKAYDDSLERKSDSPLADRGPRAKPQYGLQDGQKFARRVMQAGRKALNRWPGPGPSRQQRKRR